jgi:hypothetical protein
LKNLQNPQTDIAKLELIISDLDLDLMTPQQAATLKVIMLVLDNCMRNVLSSDVRFLTLHAAKHQALAMGISAGDIDAVLLKLQARWIKQAGRNPTNCLFEDPIEARTQLK